MHKVSQCLELYIKWVFDMVTSFNLWFLAFYYIIYLCNIYVSIRLDGIITTITNINCICRHTLFLLRTKYNRIYIAFTIFVFKNKGKKYFSINCNSVQTKYDWAPLQCSCVAGHNENVLSLFDLYSYLLSILRWQNIMTHF
jgi:hypothetical protein